MSSVIICALVYSHLYCGCLKNEGAFCDDENAPSPYELLFQDKRQSESTDDQEDEVQYEYEDDYGNS